MIFTFVAKNAFANLPDQDLHPARTFVATAKRTGLLPAFTCQAFSSQLSLQLASLFCKDLSPSHSCPTVCPTVLQVSRNCYALFLRRPFGPSGLFASPRPVGLSWKDPYPAGDTPTGCQNRKLPVSKCQACWVLSQSYLRYTV